MVLLTSDNVRIGSNLINKIYLGSNVVFAKEVFGAASLESDTVLDVVGGFDILANSSLTSGSTVDARCQLNDIREGVCSLESTSTLGLETIVFEMYVTSTSIPSIVSTSSISIEEESTNYWRVHSREEVTHMRFDYLDPNMATDVTEVEVTMGDTLTNLSDSFYLLQAMTDFTWNGRCNATYMSNTFNSCGSLVNISLFDTSAVTNMDRTFFDCYSLTSFPLFITSSCTRFLGTWTGCTSLESFPLIDTSSAVILHETWLGCSSLTAIPNINTSLCASFHKTFQSCLLLTTIPALDFSSATTTWGTFNSCNALVSLPPLDTGGSNRFDGMFYGCSNLICLSSIDTTLVGAINTLDMFTGCTSLTSPSVAEQTLILNGYDYTNTGSCPSAPIPPIYLMTEALETDGVYQYLLNSSSSGSIYNGRLEHSSLSNDEIEGTPWWPSNPFYMDDPLPAPGWIDLNANGNATRQINTQWTPPDDSEWTISGIYNLVVGVSYDMYALHYNGVDAVDIYLGSDTVPIPETPTYSNVPYTPPNEVWIIKATPPEIITPSGIIYEMDSFPTI